jgi:predicted DNA-binding transcriptional regulator
MSLNGASPYAVKVIQALLKKPMRVPEIAAVTGLAYRTVKAQVTALLRDGAIYVSRRVTPRWGGAWAEYSLIIQEVT